MSRTLPKPELFEKLTSGECDCLKRVLDHRTAKEIAQDLALTHHAVEKRLRRAREKLGAQSSVEAARWFGEHYGQTGYGSSDLAHDAPDQHKAHHPSHGAMLKRRKTVMIASMTLGLAMMTSASQEVADPVPADLAAKLEDALARDVKQAKDAFTQLDSDNSGFVEREEFVSPFSELVFNPNVGIAGGAVNFEVDVVTVQPLDGPDSETVKVTLDSEDTRARRGIMFDLIDRDKDGRIEEGEFTIAHIEGFAPRTFKIVTRQDDG